MYRLATRASALVLLLVVLQAWPGAQQKAPTTKTDSAAAPVMMINLNTATADQLDSLPGIGTKVAARIIEYRQKNGPFKKIEDLMNVRGIGEKNFLKIKNRITVGASKPASPNGQ